MKRFKLFYEVAFKNRRDVAFLQRVPKFTIFYKKEDYSESQVELFKDKEDYIASRCALALKALGKMGFRSQHTNVLIADLSDKVNENTGGGSAGYATSSGNYMSIDGNSLLSNPDYAVKIIVHEVAHLKMFRGGRAFKTAVLKFYHGLKTQAEHTLEDEDPTDPYEDSEYINPEKMEVYDKAIAVWSAAFKRFYDNRGNKYYVLQRNPSILDDHLDYFPHGWTARVEQDGKQYEIFKGNHDTFLVRRGDSRTDFKYDKEGLFKILDKEKVVAEFKKVLTYPTTYTPKASDVRESMSREFTTAYNQAVYPQSWRGLNGDDEKRTKAVVDSWVKDFIYPEYAKLIRRRDPSFLIDPKHNIYNDLWVSNPKKPRDLSIGERAFKAHLKTKHINSVDASKHSQDLGSKEFNDIRKKAAKLVEWVDDYGMSNDDEIWATGVEDFFELPFHHRRSIIKLMEQMA